MAAAVNLLIVEDDPQWCDIYVDIATREGIGTVEVGVVDAGALDGVGEVKVEGAEDVQIEVDRVGECDRAGVGELDGFGEVAGNDVG